MNFKEFLKNGFVLFDGAFGTMLQSRGAANGELPEILNITDSELIIDIHRRYVLAGSDVISTNTFGANELKLEGCGYSVEEIITAAVENAKKASPKYIALDLGPTGQLMQPMGSLSFDEAYDLYKRQIVCGTKAGADLIIIETISDLYEAKAAIIAAKENSDLPVICTMTFQEDGRTFIGTDALTASVTLQGLGVDALGVNCSMGPAGLMPIIDIMLRYSGIPVIVQANAGLPVEKNGQIVFDVPPAEYAEYYNIMSDKGVRIFGGCCGTTPEYIKRIKDILKLKSPVKANIDPITACTSGTVSTILDKRVSVIGERINPTGKKRLKEALRSKDLSYIIGEAIEQTKFGSNVLDVNCGLPEIDEPSMLCQVIREVQAVTGLPLQIDSSDPAAIEAAARIYNGKPIINSVNGKSEVMKQIFPIAKKYGALVIGLTMDERGIPATAEERLEIAEYILDTAQKYGIPKEDIIIDCLVLTASAQQAQVMETIRAIKLVKSRLGLKTVLGVSNVSFGLPARPLLNSTFLAASLGAGLDCAIMNPMSEEMSRVIDSFKVLSNEDIDSENFIRKYANINASSGSAPVNLESDLRQMIIDGRRNEVSVKVLEMLKTKDPLEIIDFHFIPALDDVGLKFEKGEIFLPQLLQSAESVKGGFDLLKEAMKNQPVKVSKGKVLIATVKGDVHDIGKNIAKMLLENYGYNVIDLGRDVPVENIVETVMEHDIKLVGLSALMTTTVKNMAETIEALRLAGSSCRVMVGGAVLNEEYARNVGADYYVKDAREGVKVAMDVFGK